MSKLIVIIAFITFKETQPFQKYTQLAASLQTACQQVLLILFDTILPQSCLQRIKSFMKISDLLQCCLTTQTHLCLQQDCHTNTSCNNIVVSRLFQC